MVWHLLVRSAGLSFWNAHAKRLPHQTGFATAPIACCVFDVAHFCPFGSFVPGCRTGPMKCRTTMRGVWRLHRIFRAAHRSRHRRCHTPRISDRLAMDDSQDWEKKMTLLLSSSQSRELVLTRRRSSLALKGACSTLRVVQSPRSPRARPRDKAKHRSDATAFSRHAS